MPTQIFYINTRLEYARHLCRYFLYVAHAIPRAMACWIAHVVFVRVSTRCLRVSRVRIVRIAERCPRVWFACRPRVSRGVRAR
jgi:hypothetical protein